VKQKLAIIPHADSATSEVAGAQVKKKRGNRNTLDLSHSQTSYLKQWADNEVASNHDDDEDDDEDVLRLPKQTYQVRHFIILLRSSTVGSHTVAISQIGQF
jgi:hypothetical protein